MGSIQYFRHAHVADGAPAPIPSENVETEMLLTGTRFDFPLYLFSLLYELKRSLLWLRKKLLRSDVVAKADKEHT